MTHAQLFSITKKYLDLFETHQPRPENIRMANERSEAWVSFKISAIDFNSKEYNIMSLFVRDLDLDESSSYEFTLSALNLLNEFASSQLGEVDEDDLQETISEWADRETPIYNHELLKWLSSGSNFCLVDETIEEMGKGESLIRDIMITYCVYLERVANNLYELISEDCNV